MYLIGLTGGIATGKSTVSKLFKEFGIEVIDGDQIAKEVVEPGKRAYTKILDAFGPEVFDSEGKLNREKLGQIIFNDSAKRKQLNSITHPEIYKTIAWRCVLRLWRRQKFIILDLPLLFETGIVTWILDHIIVARCSPDQQIDRLMVRSGYSEDEAISRINSQMDLEEKCRRASFIIDNSGTYDETELQVKKLVERLNIETKSSKRYLILDSIVFILSFGLSSLIMNSLHLFISR